MELYSQPPVSTYGFRKCCEAVRAAVPIEMIARRYTKLEPLGGRAWFEGRCPLPDHEDHDPSFYIYPPGRFHCYGCDRGGDVVDLEFYCGGYNELWEAMMALAMEYGVDLPERPSSWHQKRERQRPIRDAIYEAKVYAVRRRLYRKFFEPIILVSKDEEDRTHDAQLFWEITDRMARYLIDNMLGGYRGGR
jgi:DNA primase